MLANVIFSISMVVSSIYIFIYSLDLGGTAAIFPKLMSVPFFFFSVISLVLAFKSGHADAAPKDGMQRVRVKKYVNFVLIMLGYTLIIEHVGYYISSVGLFVLTALVLTDDDRRWKTTRSKVSLLVTALVTVAVIFLIFQVFLNVPLPGLWEE